LTSAAIGEVLNRVCDVVIWLMSANKMLRHLSERAVRYRAEFELLPCLKGGDSYWLTR